MLKSPEIISSDLWVFRTSMREVKSEMNEEKVDDGGR